MCTVIGMMLSGDVIIERHAVSYLNVHFVSACAAVTFVEQGHVRVGPETVTDPAFLVVRAFEDLVTWVDTSKIKRTVMKYNDKLDDYTLLGN